MGLRSSHGKGQFCGLSGPLKIIGSQCCGLYAAKIYNGDSGTAEPAAMLLTGRCHITLSPVKSLPPGLCCLSSKFFDHLLKLVRVRRSYAQEYSGTFLAHACQWSGGFSATPCTKLCCRPL